MSDVSNGVPSIAVLVPCYNEARTIGKVVREFRASLPDATVYVYDNNSTDGTAANAAEAGAVVRSEMRQGKGFVVQRMFADIDADIYLLVDGDDTYEAAKAPLLVELLIDDNLAMVVGRRIHQEEDAYRRGHVFGNELFTRGVATIFGKRFSDILSGYRVFSRRFVKSFPVFAHGFEIETELTVHALTLDLPVAEIDTRYGSRPAGSMSKLHTYRDGFKVISKIVSLARSERPFAFYACIGVELILLSLILAYPLIVEFIETGLVPRFPTAILSTGLALSGLLSVAIGAILDAVTLGRREAKLLAYLSDGK
jgi:glycosyltransferase involved in cell wall biosynthesis